VILIPLVVLSIRIPPTWDLKVCAVLWFATVVFHLGGNWLIRPDRKYGIAAYRAVKTSIAMVFAFILVGSLLGGSGTPSYRLGFSGLMFIMAALDTVNIWRKNKDDFYLTGKSSLGLIHFDNRTEVDLALSSAASIIRHQILDEKEYASPKAIEEVMEALGLPSGSKFAEDLRKQARERRERLARDGVLAAEVELLIKEIDG
jgi:hypothetical protein